MTLRAFAASVGSRPLIFAGMVGSQSPLFASPPLTVCRPLQLVLNVAFYNMVVRVLVPLEVELEPDPHENRYKLQ